MKTIKFLLLVLLVNATIGIYANEVYESKVSNFSRLKVINDLNVIYKASLDSAGVITFEAPDNLVADIETEIKDNELIVSCSKKGVRADNMPTIYVYSSYLEKAENYGDGLLTLVNPIGGATLKLKVQGNGQIVCDKSEYLELEASVQTGKGNIVVRGKCNNANLSVVGSGSIQADELQVEYKATCKIFGTGEIGCNTDGEISIKGSGTGKVYYSGAPKKISSVQLGSIKAIRLNDK